MFQYICLIIKPFPLKVDCKPFESAKGSKLLTKKFKVMAKFIIINGKNAKIVNCKSLEIAYHSAINICDHSKEIIVRELDELTDHTKTIENKLSAYSFLFDSVTKISDESPENEKICTKFLELLKYFDLNQ